MFFIITYEGGLPRYCSITETDDKKKKREKKHEPWTMTNTFRRQWQRWRWGRSLIRKEFNAPPSPNGYFRPRPIRTQWLFYFYIVPTFVVWYSSSLQAHTHIHRCARQILLPFSVCTMAIGWDALSVQRARGRPR